MYKFHAVECVELTKKFGNFLAVDHLSFRVAKGEIFGFLGPNGAGKSTTIKMICGILKPSSGKVYIEGNDVWENPEKIREKIGYMSQKFSLYNDLNAEENINFYCGIYGIPKSRMEERKKWVMEIAGLKGMERIKTSELSGAFKQRLAFGCAILHEPEIVFLDEPTSGVDPVSRRKFWEMIYNLSQKGFTFFVTTHFIGEAENCQRIAFINEGKISGFGSPQELKKILMGKEIYEIECSPIFLAFSVLEKKGWEGISIYGRKLRIISQSSEELEKILSVLREGGVQIFSLERSFPSLEEVFFYVTKKEAR